MSIFPTDNNGPPEFPFQPGPDPELGSDGHELFILQGPKRQDRFWYRCGPRGAGDQSAQHGPLEPRQSVVLRPYDWPVGTMCEVQAPRFMPPVMGVVGDEQVAAIKAQVHFPGIHGSQVSAPATVPPKVASGLVVEMVQFLGMCLCVPPLAFHPQSPNISLRATCSQLVTWMRQRQPQLRAMLSQGYDFLKGEQRGESEH